MLTSPMIGCSWKSHLRAPQASAWLDAVGAGLLAQEQRGQGAFVCVPHPLVSAAVEALGAAGVLVGAQDVSRYPVGPYTGEVTAELLSDLGCRLVMLGHPERVDLLGETPEVMRAKGAATARAGLAAIVVVGERTRGDDPALAARRQLADVLDAVAGAPGLVVAYEPRWAIGADRPAPPEHVARATDSIMTMLAQHRDDARVLYGGSAGPGTFAAIAGAARALRLRPPDGVFLGRAGLDPRVFLDVVAEVRRATGRDARDGAAPSQAPPGGASPGPPRACAAGWWRSSGGSPHR